MNWVTGFDEIAIGIVSPVTPSDASRARSLQQKPREEIEIISHINGDEWPWHWCCLIFFLSWKQTALYLTAFPRQTHINSSRYTPTNGLPATYTWCQKPFRPKEQTKACGPNLACGHSLLGIHGILIIMKLKKKSWNLKKLSDFWLLFEK